MDEKENENDRNQVCREEMRWIALTTDSVEPEKFREQICVRLDWADITIYGGKSVKYGDLKFGKMDPEMMRNFFEQFENYYFCRQRKWLEAVAKAEMFSEQH